MTIALIILFLAMAGNQVLMNRAQKTLSDEEKLSLLKSSSSNLLPWYMVGLAVFYGLWMLAFQRVKDPRWLLAAFSVILLISCLTFALLQIRRFKRVQIRASYVRASVIGLVLMGGGLIGLFGTMFYDSFSVLKEVPDEVWQHGR